MTLTEIVTQTKDKFYDAIYKGASAFPYSNDLMHVGLIGAVPFVAGKYGSELIGKKVPFFREHSTAMGYLGALGAEALWQGVMEPASRYDNRGDKISDYKGIIETAIGAGLLDFLTRKKKQ